MSINLTFLGGVGTVTGSKYLLQIGERRLLIDCGLFQGFKSLRLRNWARLPVDPARVDAVVLTHAHLDHSGYLPLFTRQGFTGPVFCSQATAELCAILLPDSGYLQEQDAEYANRHGFSKHHPALPLYTRADAERCLAQLRPVAFGAPTRPFDGTSFHLLSAGHILGASIVEIDAGGHRLVFSGDLGRPRDPVMVAPTMVDTADYLVVESTYGDRRHDRSDPLDRLEQVIARTIARAGTVLVPAFAVGRAQQLMYFVHELKRTGRIPDVPLFLDSPMAIDASEVWRSHADEHRLTAAACNAVCNATRYLRSAEESKSLNDSAMPSIIISASGMATGGRILHHLKRLAPDRRNTILFTGFQAGGTRGAAMLQGADRIKIHGEYVPVRAEIDDLPMLSAHADADEIMAWLRHLRRPPRLTFVTHGEPPAADALRLRIKEELGWPCLVPDYRDEFSLD